MSEQLASPVEVQILALLPDWRNGRDLARRYERETGAPLPFGTAYSSLRRMRRRGWVEVRRDPDIDQRTRLFRRTEAGATALESARTRYAGLSQFAVSGSAACGTVEA